MIEKFETDLIAILTESPRSKVGNTQVYSADFWYGNKAVYGTDLLSTLILEKGAKIEKIKIEPDMVKIYLKGLVGCEATRGLNNTVIVKCGEKLEGINLSTPSEVSTPRL